MKLTRTIGFLAVTCLLAKGPAAAAQSNTPPGPNEYSRFSSFISERNIFDPGRFARGSGRPVNYNHTRRPFTPAFSLVGIMSYDKGVFAFFDGNEAELRKVLYESSSNSIAGFSVAQITANSVTLESGDKKRTVSLKVGELMRQEDGSWEKGGQGAVATESGDEESASAGSDNAPAPSAGEPNDILTRLKQQREQQEKSN